MTSPGTRARLAIGGLATVALLALSGCSSQLSGADTAYAPTVGEAAPDRAPFVTDPDVDRSIITTGWATVLVDEPLAAASAATKIVVRAGGRIDASSVQAPSDYSGGSASLTVRVPAASVDEVLDELAALGTLEHSSMSRQDVTTQVADLGARIGALESAIDRLTELLADADTTEALIQIETALTDRQAELDSLRAQQRHLDDQVGMSTITVDFETEATSARTGPDDFVGGIVAGWEALVAFAGGLLVAAGVLLPWLVPLAIVVVIVWLIIRASRRRRRAADDRRTPPTAPATDARGWPSVPDDDA